MPASADHVRRSARAPTRIGCRATSISTPPSSAHAPKKYEQQACRWSWRMPPAGRPLGQAGRASRRPARLPAAAARPCGPTCASRSKPGRLRHFLDHADRVLGAGLDAEAAEDAARVVDLEARRATSGARDRRGVGGVDLDAPGRADRGAQVAGDALRLAVGPLRQHVLAAVVAARSRRGFSSG